MKKNLNEIKIGDIIIKPFKTMEGKWVVKHPLVITHIDKEKQMVSAWDSRAIMAAIVMSDVKSTKSKDILENGLIDTDIIVGRKQGARKDSLLQLEVVILFSKDILPVDVRGELDPEYVKSAVKIISELDKMNLLKINKFSLPEVTTELEFEENKKSIKDDGLSK